MPPRQLRHPYLQCGPGTNRRAQPARRPRCDPRVGLRRDVTLVRAGSVSTEGKWFRQLDVGAQVAPACGQAARERVPGQIQIAQCGEPTELAQDLPTRLHSPQIQSRHPSVVIGTNPPVLGRGVREAKLQHGFDPGLEGASRRVDGPRRRQAQQHRLVGGGHRVLKVGTGGRTGYGSVCLGWGVTLVRAG